LSDVLAGVRIKEIDREHDRGTYVEANLWMRHA